MFNLRNVYFNSTSLLSAEHRHCLCLSRLEVNALRSRLQVSVERQASADDNDTTNDNVTSPSADTFKNQELQRLEAEVMDLQVRAAQCFNNYA